MPVALATPIVAIGLVAVAAVAIGCGPSIRRVHRARVYFERCYAADLEEGVPDEERRACWQQWVKHYQVGQPPDRIDYVRERILQLDPESAEILAMAAGVEEEPEPAIAIVTPIETEAAAAEEPIAQPLDSASEPPTIAVAASGEPVEVTPIGPAPEVPSTVPPARTRRAARTPPIPRSDSPRCGEACRPVWESCLATCDGRDVPACHRSCRLQHRTCARACY